MRILVTGSRRWPVTEKGLQPILREVKKYDADTTTIITGTEEGVESLVVMIAETYQYELDTYEDGWDQYGWRAQGAMLDKSKPDKVIVFHEALQFSKKSKSLVRQAAERNIPVEVYNK